MNENDYTMQQITALQNYLQNLYDGYEQFQEDYHNIHRRSRMHNKEHITEYYIRWRDKMRAEIRRVETLLITLLPSPCRPCIGFQLGIKNEELKIEIDCDIPYKINHLQNVAISEILEFHY